MTQFYYQAALHSLTGYFIANRFQQHWREAQIKSKLSAEREKTFARKSDDLKFLESWRLQ